MAAPPDDRATETAADPAEQTAAPAADRRRWSAWRILAVMGILAMVLFWIWILSGAPAKQNPDWITDRAYVDRLEGRCKALLEDLDALPKPDATPTAEARVKVIDQANVMVGDFIDRIDEGAPTTGSSAKGLQGWIEDWRTYQRDRLDYAKRLHQDPKARLYIDKSPLGRPVDETIEIFAQVNHIEDCATPGDVG